MARRAPGLIREAIATTRAAATDAPIRERLVLRATPLFEATIVVGLPAASRFERAIVDGREVAPATSENHSYSFTLEETGSPKREHTVVLEYEYFSKTNGLLGDDPPTFSWPCLSFSRGVATVESRSIEPAAAGVFGSPPIEDERRGRAFIGEWGSEPLTIRRDLKAFDGALDDIDTVAARVDGPWTLADFLTRADSGRAAIVIDRVALEELGIGPLSPVSPIRPPRSKSDSIPEALFRVRRCSNRRT